MTIVSLSKLINGNHKFLIVLFIKFVSILVKKQVEFCYPIHLS